MAQRSQAPIGIATVAAGWSCPPVMVAGTCVPVGNGSPNPSGACDRHCRGVLIISPVPVHGADVTTDVSIVGRHG